ncbi:MAG: hypothetical protein ABIZ36_07790 [Gemmatimonadaceae bacterium]
MKIRLAALAACVAIAAGCNSSSHSSAADTVAAIPASPVRNTVPAVSETPAEPCPHDGKWALCSIERRMKQSGFVVKKVDSVAVSRAGFSIKPTVYSLGQSRLEVFLYSDSVSLMKDIAKLDTVVVGPRGTLTQWGDIPPVLVRSANLAGVILSLNQRQVERAILSITAGPPQPGSPR